MSPPCLYQNRKVSVDHFCYLPADHSGDHMLTTDPKILYPSKKRFLHVACGHARKADVAAIVTDIADWDEIRCDLDTSVEPDVVADMRSLAPVESESFDGLYCSHALEHLHANDWHLALSSFRRVLKPGALMVAIVPNLVTACRAIAMGHAGPLYESPVGPIYAHEVLFGKENWTESNSYMRHLSGFTPDLLRGLVLGAGFRVSLLTVDDNNLMIAGVKR